MNQSKGRSESVFYAEIQLVSSAFEIKGVFEDIFKDIKLDELDSDKDNSKNLYIALNKKNIQEKVILYKVKGDVIGKKYDEKSYQYFH